MNPIAVAEIVIVSVYLMLPFIPAANPFSDDFEWKYVNYAPIVTLGALLILVDLVGGLGEEVVHRPEAHHRPRRRRGLRHLTCPTSARRPAELSRGGAASVQQVVEVGAVELRDGQVVLLHAPGPEVEVDRADLGLDRGPQRPAVPRHQAEQPGPGDLVAQVLGRSSCRRAPRGGRATASDSLQMLPSSKHGSLLPPYS